MMGRQVGEAQLFYISVDRHVPADHVLRRVDAVLDLSFIRSSQAEYYSHMGRLSIDPELMIRMLLVGYLYGIRSETRICEEVHLNLAYRWFCRLGLDGDVPERSTFSKNRHGRFREGDLFRRLFEEVVRRCVAAAWSAARVRRWTAASSRPMPVASAACPAIACPRHGQIGRARHSPSARTWTHWTPLPHRIATSPSRLRRSTSPRPILRRPGRPRPVRGASVMRPTTWSTPRMR